MSGHSKGRPNLYYIEKGAHRQTSGRPPFSVIPFSPIA
nr:MAG TPA: cobalt/magnesium transport protein [Caudoviricetes sp.]